MSTCQNTGLPLEIERKFLIAMPDLSLLESIYPCRRAELIQTYLRLETGEATRVREWKENGRVTYIQTTKTRLSDMTRIERERTLTYEEYTALLSYADPHRAPIQKVRICLTYRDQCFEIDLYPFWSDQAIMEIELPCEDAPIEFPPHIQILREVTSDPRYKNSELAKKTIQTS